MNNPHAMGELCTLMLYRQLDADVFARWVRRHFGDPGATYGSEALAHWVAKNHLAPHPLDKLRMLEFDQWLMRPEVEDNPFTRAMIELRNVFARHANMATAGTVKLDVPPPAMERVPKPVVTPPERLPPVATSVLAETLAKLLCAQPHEPANDEGDILPAS